MPVQDHEITAVIIIGAVIAFLLIFFIVMALFLYQKRQHRHEKELKILQEEFNSELTRSQIEIQETTLKNISQDLHDNIGQILSVTNLSISGARLEKEHPSYEIIQGARGLLKKAIEDLSHITKSLHTERITQIGLVEAIAFEVQTIKRTGLMQEINYHVSDYDETIDSQTTIFLFRMFQELLNNTLKHAKATRIDISINFTNNKRFILQMEDNGIGFDVNEKINSPTSSGGVGLKSMANRAKLIGADFTITSEKEKGTKVIINVPLGKNPLLQ
jgi:signal transduction histidine kinase